MKLAINLRSPIFESPGGDSGGDGECFQANNGAQGRGTTEPQREHFWQVALAAIKAWLPFH